MSLMISQHRGRSMRNDTKILSRYLDGRVIIIILTSRRIVVVRCGGGGGWKFAREAHGSAAMRLGRCAQGTTHDTGAAYTRRGRSRPVCMRFWCSRRRGRLSDDGVCVCVCRKTVGRGRRSAQDEDGARCGAAIGKSGRRQSRVLL